MNKKKLYLLVFFGGLLNLINKANSQDHLSNLLPELKGYICRYLSTEEISRFSQTCRTNYKMIDNASFNINATNFDECVFFSSKLDKDKKLIFSSKLDEKRKLISYVLFAKNHKVFVCISLTHFDEFYLEILPKCTYVQSLDLSENYIDDANAQALASFLEGNTILRKLICYLTTSDSGIKTFSQMLKSNKSLKALNLIAAHTEDPLSMQPLIDALKINNSLTSLNLGLTLDDRDIQNFAEILHTNKSLKKLKLSIRHAYFEKTHLLAEALKINTTIKKLNLDACFVKTEIQLFSEMLKINQSLKELNLGGNIIGDNGAQALAEALKINQSLKELNLGGNTIGDNGAQGLAEALKINQSLKELNLGGNTIGDNGTQGLAEALKVNTTLTQLDLRSNKIGDVGAQALAEALKVNTTLTHLYLQDNDITDEGAWALLGTPNLRDPMGLRPRLKILL